MLKVGDEVYLEEAWEDDGGGFHDEYATVTRVYLDGTCRFHLDTAYPEYKRQKIQAWINKFGFYAKDYAPVTTAASTKPLADDKSSKNAPGDEESAR